MVLGGLRPDTTYPGDPGAEMHKRWRPPCPITEGALDLEWLPIVGAEGWLTLSRDRNIQDSFAELSAVREHSVKMVCLTGESAKNKWAQLECMFTYWHRVEPLPERDGPFVFKLSKPGGLREVNIDEALDRLRNGRRRRRT
jgi:hypothetical protein